jgi:DNA-binding NtrC family response regulator
VISKRKETYMDTIKVLLIEDEKISREQLAKVIRKEGFEVLEAENGRVGLDVFKKELPEIVVTDVKMPDVDGLEVMHTVRRFSKNVQIILITAFGETDTVIAALREGALDYLKKPLDLDQLTLALGRAKERIVELKKSPVFPTILLVEDEEGTRGRLVRMLGKEGWRVLQAGDGEEALEVFQQEKTDIVLLDIKMPKKDGIQTLHEMREITVDFEAIILTGYGDEKSAIQALRDGAINFLRKPLDVEQLIITVHKAIEKINLARALRYRTRELELAKEIIAQITVEKEIIIDASKHTPKPVREFAQMLLDVMPLGLVVLNQDMKLRYVNPHVARLIGYQPEVVDEEFVQKLDKAGIRELTYETLHSTINKLFDSPAGTVETLSAGKYSYLTLVPLTILGEEKKESVILIAMRGERNSK